MLNPKNKILIYKYAENIIGRQVVKQIYLKACVRNYIKKRIIFIHMPKCAGTSITNNIYGKRVGHFKATEVKEELKENFSKLKSFSISRNPFDRIYSAYRFITNNGGDDGAVRKEDYFDNKSFNNFDSFVQEWLCVEDNFEKNILFQKQKDFVFNSKGNLLLDKIFKIEDSDLEYQLSNFLEKDFKLNHYNKTNSDHDFKFSSETKKIIENIYKDDYDLLNY